MMTASTVTPLRSPSAEPVVMAGTPFCATVALPFVPFKPDKFVVSPFNDLPLMPLKAPAGVTHASSATMVKGAPMIEVEREKCNIALPMAKVKEGPELKKDGADHIARGSTIAPLTLMGK
jgi:hypothetical protein